MTPFYFLHPLFRMELGWNLQ